MKKIYFLIAILFATCAAMNAHPPAKFNYQGVARNATGLPIVNQRISLKISIFDTKVANTQPVLVYCETQVDTTNEFGLFNIAVGGGVIVSGAIKDINWAAGEKDMQVEIDPAGGTAYVSLGKTRLLSVPFSRRAEDAGMLSIYGGNDPIHTNPNKMIIRHSITHPTWGLHYSDENSQFNFLKAGMSVMDVDLVQSKVNINGTLKITGGDPGAGKVLVSDSAGQGSWMDAGSKVSAFQPNGCQILNTVNTTFQKIADMGSFTKTTASTFLKLTLQTTVFADSLIASKGLVFELRVDNQPTNIGNATLLLQSAGISVPVTFGGVFQGLAGGTHTLSLWTKTVSGSAKNAGWDKDCLNAQGVNTVLVEEYR